MEIKEVKDKKEWEDFILECEEKTFLQSWNWGEFNKKMGNKIWRLGLFSAGGLFSGTLVIKIKAKRGTFLFLPHGPLIKYGAGNRKYEVLKTLLNKLKEIAKEEKASFIRIAPIWERNEENKEIFKKLGFKNAPIHMHPEATWELNILLSEQELLMQTRKTTRYLIRQGLRNKDIQVIQNSDIESFNKIYQETAGRHNFTPFSFEYLKNEFSAFEPDNKIALFLGKYKNEVIASSMIIFYQNTAFYHQGASSLKYSKIPINYLLQWEAIKEAKKRGCKIYNFWGIADVKTENKKHPWWGLTLFKMGFGGYKKEYVKTQDLPLSRKYWLTYIFEKLRKIKRGL